MNTWLQGCKNAHCFPCWKVGGISGRTSGWLAVSAGLVGSCVVFGQTVVENHTVNLMNDVVCQPTFLFHNHQLVNSNQRVFWPPACFHWPFFILHTLGDKISFGLFLRFCQISSSGLANLPVWKKGLMLVLDKNDCRRYEVRVSESCFTSFGFVARCECLSAVIRLVNVFFEGKADHH